MKKQKTDKIADMIDSAEKKDQIILNWRDHVEQRHSIKSFSSIMNDTMYTIMTDEHGSLFPHVEFNGTNETHWIVKISPTGREIFRANIKSLDMIDWNLFPLTTN